MLGSGVTPCTGTGLTSCGGVICGVCCLDGTETTGRDGSVPGTETCRCGKDEALTGSTAVRGIVGMLVEDGG